MINQVLLTIGGALPIVWGIAHLLPTRSIVEGFGDITLDNKRILTMEWITEAVALIFSGAVVIAVTYVDRASGVAGAVYLLSFAMLNTLSVVSLFTGFRVNFFAFKLCPLIFTGSSILILLGYLL